MKIAKQNYHFAVIIDNDFDINANNTFSFPYENWYELQFKLRKC